MHIFKKYLIMLASIIAFTINMAQAEQVSLKPAKPQIPNLETVLSDAKTKIHFKKNLSDEIIPTTTFIAFPDKVPNSPDKLFASLTNMPNGSYVINIDATADCQGAKMCGVGALTLAPQENITVYFDRDNKQATSLVMLDKGIQGFYTRGFAMADFTPASIQWRDGDVLYILSWNIEDKKSFIEMANSIIKQLHKK